MKLDAGTAIHEASQHVAGLPVFIAGSSVAAAKYGTEFYESYDDIDMFCATDAALFTAVTRLMAGGYELEDRARRVWERWMRFGIKGWHTNSIKLADPLSEVAVNVVYKTTNGHATTSLAQVIESFDFGLLAIGGWDMTRGSYHDMRQYLFPNHPDGPLPLMPNKQADWRNGFISQYNGLREFGRYIKYYDYGYDMSLVKDDLVTGYWQASMYLRDRDKPEKQALGKIYESLAANLEHDNLDKLREAAKEVLYIDSLDAIMDSLE